MPKSKLSLIIWAILTSFSLITIANNDYANDIKQIEAFREAMLGHYFQPFYGEPRPPQKSKLFSSQRQYKGFQLRPLYSHSYVEYQGKEYSVWIVRPVLWKAKNGESSSSPSSAYVRDPQKPYSNDRKIMFGEIHFSDSNAEKAFWNEHESQTKTLMGHFRNAIGEVYAEQGYFSTTEKAEKQNKIFDRIFNGSSSIMAVTEKDNPSKVYQQVAVLLNEGDGLPIDFELEELGAKRLESDPIQIRNFPAVPNPEDAVVASTQAAQIKSKKGEPLFVQQSWLSGEKVEIKALMKSKDSPQDFLGLLLNQSIKHKLMHGSLIEIPMAFRQSPKASIEQLAFYDWTNNPIGYKNLGTHSGDFNKVAIQHGYSWLSEPILDQTVRNTRVYVSTHSKGIERLYVSGLGFEPNPVRVVQDKDGHEMKVLTTDIGKLESETYRRALERATSSWLQDAVLRPAEKDIFGKPRPFVQLESFAQGERRALLKEIAPRAEALIADYHLKVFAEAQKKSHEWVRLGQERNKRSGVDISAFEYRTAKATIDASLPTLFVRKNTSMTVETFNDSLTLPDSVVHAAYEAAHPKIVLENINHQHPELENQLKEKWMRFSGERSDNPPLRVKLVNHFFNSKPNGEVHFYMEVEFPENVSEQEMRKIIDHGKIQLNLVGQDVYGGGDEPSKLRSYERQVQMKFGRCYNRNCRIVPLALTRTKPPPGFGDPYAMAPIVDFTSWEFNGADPNIEKIMNVVVSRPFSNDRVKGYIGWPERKNENPLGGCGLTLSGVAGLVK